MFRFILYFFCLTLPLAAQAELYKITNEYGDITYTDIAPNIGAKEHKFKRATSAVSNPGFNLGKLALTIPFVDEGGSMIVNGSINGVALRFIMDTGATLLAIPPSIAKQAGLYELKIKSVSVQTANGKIKVPRVTIPSVTVAKVKQSKIKATIQIISEDRPDLGLLGMNFFDDYKITIDRKKKEIQLEQK